MSDYLNKFNSDKDEGELKGSYLLILASKDIAESYGELDKYEKLLRECPECSFVFDSGRLYYTTSIPKDFTYISDSNGVLTRPIYVDDKYSFLSYMVSAVPFPGLSEDKDVLSFYFKEYQDGVPIMSEKEYFLEVENRKKKKDIILAREIIEPEMMVSNKYREAYIEKFPWGMERMERFMKDQMRMKLSKDIEQTPIAVEREELQKQIELELEDDVEDVDLGEFEDYD